MCRAVSFTAKADPFRQRVDGLRASAPTATLAHLANNGSKLTRGL